MAPELRAMTFRCPEPLHDLFAMQAEQSGESLSAWLRGAGMMRIAIERSWNAALAAERMDEGLRLEDIQTVVADAIRQLDERD